MYILTGLIGGEVAARITAYLRTTKTTLSGKGYYRLDSELGYVLVSGKTVNGIKFDSLGFRGKEYSTKKPKDMFRILCVGNYITFGAIASADSTTYPAILENTLTMAKGRRITIEVMNCGVNGYSSRQSLLDLHLHLLSLKPDAIILCTGWNDMILSKQVGWHRELTGLLNRDYFTFRESFLWWMLRTKLLRLPATVAQDRLADFRHNVEDFGRTCDSSGVILMLLDLPTILSEQMTESEKANFLKSTFKPGEEPLFLAYRQVILDVAAQFHHQLLSSTLNYDHFNKDSLIVDNCHPNNRGYRTMVSEIAPQVERLIPRN